MGDAPPGPPAGSPVLTRGYLVLIAISALMGIPVAIAASAFTSLTNELREALWVDLPDAAGWSEPPA